MTHTCCISASRRSSGLSLPRLARTFATASTVNAPLTRRALPRYTPGSGRSKENPMQLRRSLAPVCLLLPTLACLLAAEAHAADARPNVLFIAIDDLNDWVGCLGGHPQVKTPHIDRLARHGTLFTNAHCQAPLCNPSRSSLLTGLRPSTTGIYALQPGIRAVAALKDHVTLPQHFAKHGYHTFTAGKVFHDGSIPPADRAKEFQVWGDLGRMPYPPK